MQPLILIADGMDKQLFDQLGATPGLKVHPKAKNSADEVQALLPQIQGLVVRSATNPDRAFLEKAKQLKYIIRAGEGVDNIDVKFCQERGIKVSNTPGANNNSAAEHAIALMFTVLRHTAWANATTHAGKWEKNAYMGNELTGKTLGIVGFGRIGQIVAKRLSGFEPKVLFYDPFNTKTDIPYAQAAKNLEEVFEQSDIVTLHTPLMEATKNMVGKALLQRMKPQSILVNAARGKIVNETDLLEVLRTKKIRGAGFDVFATEPLPADSPLRGLENLVLTPHLGASTEEAQWRVGEMVVHQLKQFFLHNQLLNEVRV